MSANSEKASEIILAVLVIILFSPFLIELLNVTYGTNFQYSMDFVTDAVKVLVVILVITAFFGAITN